MNLKKIQKKLNELLNKELDLDFEFEYEGDKLVTKGVIYVNALDENIVTRITFYESGLIGFIFTFNNLDHTKEALELINTFNSDSLYFKAYIDEYLFMEHSAIYVAEDKLADYTKEIILELVDDDFIDKITPIINLTYEE